MFFARGIRRVTVIAACTIVGVLAFNSTASAQTSRIQIIHNSPDPAVQWLSLYLNDVKVADSLLFRNAKQYVEVNSGIGIQAGFAPLNSSSSGDVFQTVTINLEEDKDYVAVILGVVDPNYLPNPDGVPIGLTLLIKETRPLAASPESSDYLFINGATDAPNLDFRPRGGDPIGSGVPYGSAVGYVPFDKYVYTMDVAPTEAPERILGFFDLDVGYLKDKAFTVLTSGFVNRFRNGSGPELKIMVVTSDGFTQAIGSSEPTDDLATMQVINNSPDLNFLGGFDIYFNGGRAINDLKFKRATSFFGIEGGETITIEIKNSAGGLSIRSTTLTVEPGTNYLLMVTGVVNTAEYAPNPDGEPLDLSLTINPNIRRFPSQLGVGEFIFAQGVPDASLANLEITGLSQPIENVPFGEMTGYRSISDFDILVEMVAANGDLPTFLSHHVDIPFVLGRTFVLYSAGFAQPSKNRDGEPAQLMLALNDGAVVGLRFREIPSEASRLQLIHASADPVADSVDVYLDFKLVGDNVPFESGTPFIDVRSGRTSTISVAPPESDGVEDAIASFPVQFEEGTTYAGIIGGVSDPASFAPNPDAIATGLGLHLIKGALENGLDGTQLTMMAANAITDSPAASVTVEQTQTIATGIAFRKHGAYGVVPALYRFVDVTRSANANRIGASYIGFEGLSGRAGILVAAGFADPSANGNGPGFSTFLVLDDGSVVRSDQNIVSTEDDNPEVPSVVRINGNYPNPFAVSTSLSFDLPEAASVSLEILDAMGRIVKSVPSRLVPAGLGQTINIAADNLPAGIYLYSFKAVTASGTQEARGRMMLVK